MHWLLATIMLVMQAQAQDEATITVHHADSLVVRSIAGETIRELIGQVSMQQENVRITCDHAIQNISRNSAELIGNVIIIQDTLTLKASHAQYDGNDRLATCNRGVHLNDGQVTLTADRGMYETSKKIARFYQRVQVDESTVSIFSGQLVYFRDSSKAIATEKVLITSKEKNTVITGDSVIHFVKKKISFIPLRPKLWQVDSTVVRRDPTTGKVDSLRLDTLTIVSKSMEAYRDSNARYIARDSVEIVRSGLAARCGEGLFHTSDSLVVLRFAPVLWYETNQMTGDSINVQMRDGAIHFLHVIGNAFAISKSKPTAKDTGYPRGRFDQSKGKSILMVFHDDEIDSVYILKTAMRVYYLYDERALNGVGVESGDQIILSFDAGEPETIKTIGGIEGKYYPEKMVTGKEETFNLEGFLWRDDRPAKPIHPKEKTK